MSKYPYLGVNELDQSRHAQPCSKKQKATQTVQKPHTLLFTPCIIFTFKSHQQFLHCFAIFLFILFCQSLFLLCFFFLRSILAVSSNFVVIFFSLGTLKRELCSPQSPVVYPIILHPSHIHPVQTWASPPSYFPQPPLSMMLFLLHPSPFHLILCWPP